MKITYAGNNKNGLNVLKELINQGVEVEYLFLHPKKTAKFSEEIKQLANVNERNVFYWKETKEEVISKKLEKKESDILLSINFGYKIPKEILKKYRKALNLHISYLPYNKGCNPNVWAIVEGTPAGVTVHEMAENIDEGQIIYQEEVKVESTDTGKTLYEKLEKKSVEIIRREFFNIINGKYQPKDNKGGTIHFAKEFKQLCKLDLNKEYKAKDLINILRALTYPPYNNAYFIDGNGEKVYIEVKLTKEE